MDAVDTLLHARLTTRPITVDRSALNIATLAQGYDIGHALDRRLRDRGWQACGRKLGFTNRDTWAEFGLATPIWSTIYAQTVEHVGDVIKTLDHEQYVAPRLEPEIVVALGDGIGRSEAREDAVAASIQWIAPAFEVVDCHLPDWQFTAAEITADFGAHAGLLIGPRIDCAGDDSAAIAEQLASVEVTLKCNGETIDDGVGRNALGGPVSAVVEFMRTLATQPWAGSLAGGEIITTGTLTSIPHLSVGDRWEATYSGFGDDDVSIACVVA